MKQLKKAGRRKIIRGTPCCVNKENYSRNASINKISIFISCSTESTGDYRKKRFISSNLWCTCDVHLPKRSCLITCFYLEHGNA